METIDGAKQKFESIRADVESERLSLGTEQDARFQIVDRILLEVASWQREDIKTEPHVESGFIDYLLSAGERHRFVVEAKRTEIPLVDTAATRRGTYKINGPALDAAKDSIRQVRNYSVDVGVNYCCLTNGETWLFFYSTRTDGISPAEGKAIVFPNLRAVSDNFAEFFDLISNDSILSQTHRVLLDRAEGTTAIPASPLYQPIAEQTARLVPRSKVASDLDKIFSEFFGRMSGDIDREILTHCFVESKESKDADLSLTRIARNLISSIEEISTAEGEELARHIQDAITTNRGEFVLIIGNKGAGKSTFIDRFFELVLARSLLRKCMLVHIDLAKHTGDIPSLPAWLTQELKRTIEAALFKDGIPQYDELQGVFFQDYRRWSEGEFYHLYRTNRDEFKIKFGSHISELIECDPYQYVLNMINNAIFARRLMPCLIFDNSDNYTQNFQEAVFQYAQSIFRSKYSFIIIPLTDRTIWRLSKSGPMQSYETTAFYLPVPSTRDVLLKRIEFMKSKIEAEREVAASYFLGKGIRVDISDIRRLAALLEEVFIESESTSRFIGFLANHDIRRSLDISRRIITSPVISSDSLLGSYLVGGRIEISDKQLARGLILGDRSIFQQGHSHYILNLFDVSGECVTSPLLKLRIIKLLLDRRSSAREHHEYFVKVEDIVRFFEPVGVSDQACKREIGVLFEFRLVEGYDPSVTTLAAEETIRVTHSGEIHYELAMKWREYLFQMAKVTGTTSSIIADYIRDQLRYENEEAIRGNVERRFAEYCLEEDAKFIKFSERDSSGVYTTQATFRNKLAACWGVAERGREFAGLGGRPA